MRNKPEWITPKMAQQMLTKNTANRPLNEKICEEYAAAMAAGEWICNGDAIRFDKNGTLIDGQKRLLACVKSGKRFQTYIVHDLPPEAFDSIDRGQPRTLGHVLARRGEKAYLTLAAAVRLLNDITTSAGTPGRMYNKLRPRQMDAILNQHPQIRDSVEKMLNGMGSGQRLLPDSLAAALHYLFTQVKPQKADEFWTRVTAGEGLTKDMPEFILRKKLVQNLSSPGKLPQTAIAAMCVKAWNAASQNKPMAALRWQDGEEFPKIVGSKAEGIVTIPMVKKESA